MASVEAFEIDKGRNGPPEPPLRPRRRLREEDPPDPPRSHLLIWLALFVVLVALLGVDWYGLSRIVTQSARLDTLDGWMEQMSAVPGRLGAAEQRIKTLSGSITSLEDRTSGLDRKLAAGLAEQQKATRDLRVSLQAQMRGATEVQANTSGARLDALEAAHDIDSARTARLEREVAQLHRQMAAASDNLGSVQNAAARESQQLRRDIQTTNARVEHVASFNNRPRERFEARLGKTEEITPNILLHITRVNPSHRRFRGWLQLVDEGKILWLRDESVLQTVAFYAGSSTLRHDLVVTGLSPGGVTGYLIFPSVGESAHASHVTRPEAAD